MSDRFVLHHGDCLDVLLRMSDASVDSIVTDPPYGLSFMGKKWDYDVPSVEVWQEALRVLKPGGHLLAFAGTRTQHRMACRIEDAGFEIRDMIAWVYGSGFPKSMDVSKAIDNAAGMERDVIGVSSVTGARAGSSFDDGCKGNNRTFHNDVRVINYTTAPATEAAKQWNGFGTALKPALEPITLARKPLIGTVAANVLEHGTGALNVDGCRVATDPNVDDPRLGGNGTWSSSKMAKNVYEGGYAGNQIGSSRLGRWPANLIHDGSDEATSPLGDASRFFYCAKASKADRDDGCGGLPEREAGIKNDSGRGFSESDPHAKILRANHHPTVKPTDLMRYLCRLVTPPGGLVLDPFMGSGSTGKAAILEGFRFIGIEREAEYLKIAESRIAQAVAKNSDLLPFD